MFEKTFRHGEGKIAETALKAHLEFLSGVDWSCDCDIGSVSSHFHRLSVCHICHSSWPVVESILRGSSLSARDEDSGFDAVYRRAPCSFDSLTFGI
jgi:hypothetical protein